MGLPAAVVEKDKQLLANVQDLTEASVLRVVPDFARMTRQEAGGVVRSITRGTVARFGVAATQSARVSYADMREAASAAGRFAAIGLTLNSPEISESLIGGVMLNIAENKTDEARNLLSNGLGKIVADIYRQTIVQNIQRDSFATGFQRIASPGACAFCALATQNRYTTFPAAGGFHNNCQCSTVPIFRGQSAYKPAWFDQFEQEYVNATRATVSNTTADILATWRKQTGRK